jgi:hypothetical protein
MKILRTRNWRANTVQLVKDQSLERPSSRLPIDPVDRVFLSRRRGNVVSHCDLQSGQEATRTLGRAGAERIRAGMFRTARK